MSELKEAIRLIEQQVIARGARCAIADEGCADESSLLGTRDGYLNLALALLRFVAEAEAGECQIEQDRHVWDDQIKNVLYQLPTNGTWLVGAYLFQNHADFMTHLTRFVDSQIGHSLLNDPQFHDPEGIH